MPFNHNKSVLNVVLFSLIRTACSINFY